MLFIISTPVIIRHLCQPKTVVFLNRYLMCDVLLEAVVIDFIRKHIGKPKSATLVKFIVK